MITLRWWVPLIGDPILQYRLSDGQPNEWTTVMVAYESTMNGVTQKRPPVQSSLEKAFKAERYEAKLDAILDRLGQMGLRG